MDERQIEPREAGRAALRRRGVLAAIGAAVAAGIAKASECTAHAANGEALIIGNTGAGQVGAQTATAPTFLSATTTSGALPTLFLGASGLTVAVRAEAATGVAVSALSIANHGVQGATNAGPGSGVAGVRGFGNSSIGVLGTSGQSAGVSGESNSGVGVLGTSAQSAGVSGDSTSGVGVLGNSNFSNAVYGISQNAYGARGNSVAPPGTVVTGGGLAAGVYGFSQYNAGVYGYTFGPTTSNVPTYGTIGQSEGGFGAWGLCSAPPGTIASPGGGGLQAVAGVLGTSSSNVGMYAISTGNYALVADANGPSTVGALVRKPGGQAAVFVGNVQVQGNLHVTGSIQNPAPPAGASAAATEGGGQRPMAPDGTDAWLEDVGEGRVERGTATVTLEPRFAAFVLGDGYQVFLTSYDSMHLHVANRTSRGFEVRVTEGVGRAADLLAGRASAVFGYRVVGRRRPDTPRPDAAVAPLHVPTVPATHGAPSLPGHAGADGVPTRPMPNRERGPAAP